MIDGIEMHALADGQLEGEAKAQAEAKLSDPAFKAEFETVQALKGVLHAKAEAVTCEKTWAKCRERLTELDKRRSVETIVGRYAWGLCSVFLALIIGAGLFNRATGFDGIGTGDAARMLSGLTPASRSDSQPVEMKSWVRHNSPKTIRLVSHAVGHFQGHPVALYNIEDDEGRLAVLDFKGVTNVAGVEPMLENQEYSVGKLNGTNCVTWSEPDSTMFLVGNRPYEKLAEVATELRNE